MTFKVLWIEHIAEHNLQLGPLGQASAKHHVQEFSSLDRALHQGQEMSARFRTHVYVMGWEVRRGVRQYKCFEMFTNGMTCAEYWQKELEEYDERKGHANFDGTRTVRVAPSTKRKLPDEW